MSDYKRSDRVAGEVSHALSRILQEGLRDPRVSTLTITSVRMSDDLSIARVNFVPLGGHGNADDIIDGLNSARGYLRRELGRRVRLKYVPELRFHLDEQLDRAMGMTALLDKLSAARAHEE
ncbi:MAG: 30S ribosome-binding factor RbfA [Myxococcota bacterium]|nr:30S ribosome-binding factor RbfA [Myxococcota bacterium]MEC8424834.1 30S ribosome-binding factor RbfA [Myxococcota bacterium]